LVGGTDEAQENPAGIARIQAKTRTENFPNMNLQRYNSPIGKNGFELERKGNFMSQH
jgi:hypothetical protein